MMRKRILPIEMEQDCCTMLFSLMNDEDESEDESEDDEVKVSGEK